MTSDALQAVADADETGLSVSVFSAWEIGMLAARGKLSTSVTPLKWFDSFVQMSGAAVVEATPSILIGSSFLPGGPHGDPMDRILIATARDRALTILTRDRAILSYAAAGHVSALAC